jgi:hypothetical protein
MNTPWGKIKDIMIPNAHPLAQITRISKGDAACYDPGFHLSLRRDISGTRDNHFECRANFTADKLHLICNQQAYVLYILELFPASGQKIPL